MTTLTHGSLFTGIGGFDLAAEWCGIPTLWHSEIEPYACRVLKCRFPNVPNLGDIRKVSFPQYVDIITGGFPCQDISVAGTKQGITGARSGLWKEQARIISQVRPRWAIIENSPNLRNKGLEVVLQDLWTLGYDAEWHCIPAAAVGAPHQRDRIWVIAYPNANRERCNRRGNHRCQRHLPLDTKRNASAPLQDVEESQPDSGTLCSFLADALRQRQQRQGTFGHASNPKKNGKGQATNVVHGDFRYPRTWVSEPAVGRVAHGVPNRVDRLRCLGNAVVPAIPHVLFQAIQAAEQHALA